MGPHLSVAGDHLSLRRDLESGFNQTKHHVSATEIGTLENYYVKIEQNPWAAQSKARLLIFKGDLMLKVP